MFGPFWLDDAYEAATKARVPEPELRRLLEAEGFTDIDVQIAACKALGSGILIGDTVYEIE